MHLEFYVLLVSNDQLHCLLKLFSLGHTPLKHNFSSWYTCIWSCAVQQPQTYYLSLSEQLIHFFWLTTAHHISLEQIYPHTKQLIGIHKVNVLPPQFLKQMSSGFHCSMEPNASVHKPNLHGTSSIPTPP